MQEVVRAKVIKLLDPKIIYLIYDNTQGRLSYVVPKKSGITIVINEKEEVILTRLTFGWRLWVDYIK